MCHETQPLDNFHIDKAKSSGRRGYCKACSTKRERARYANDPDRAYHNRLQRVFGLTLTEYDERLYRQGGVCLICQTTCVTGKRLAVDHDHDTGRVRGLLCTRCNQGIGLFLDNPLLLRSAATYLESVFVNA